MLWLDIQKYMMNGTAWVSRSYQVAAWTRTIRLQLTIAAAPGCYTYKISYFKLMVQ